MVFCNSASLMFMPAKVWGLKQSKNSQNICFGPSKLTCIHGKLIKILYYEGKVSDGFSKSSGTS